MRPHAEPLKHGATFAGSNRLIELSPEMVLEADLISFCSSR